MNCLRCGKPLIAFAASIKTRDGIFGWGPKCAKTVQIMPRPRPRPWLRSASAEIADRVRQRRQEARPGDPRQAELFEALS